MGTGASAETASQDALATPWHPRHAGESGTPGEASESGGADAVNGAKLAQTAGSQAPSAPADRQAEAVLVATSSQVGEGEEGGAECSAELFRLDLDDEEELKPVPLRPGSCWADAECDDDVDWLCGWDNGATAGKAEASCGCVGAAAAATAEASCRQAWPGRRRGAVVEALKHVSEQGDDAVVEALKHVSEQGDDAVVEALKHVSEQGDGAVAEALKHVSGTCLPKKPSSRASGADEEALDDPWAVVADGPPLGAARRHGEEEGAEVGAALPEEFGMLLARVTSPLLRCETAGTDALLSGVYKMLAAVPDMKAGMAVLEAVVESDLYWELVGHDLAEDGEQVGDGGGRDAKRDVSSCSGSPGPAPTWREALARRPGGLGSDIRQKEVGQSPRSQAVTSRFRFVGWPGD